MSDELKKRRFEEIRLDKKVLKGIENLNYEYMTEVQSRSIPLILEGKDLVIKSQTGSGKTATFGIPICNEVIRGKKNPQVLVVVPTRELAIQVRKDIKDIGKYRKLRVVEIYGQSPYKKQLRELRQGAEVLVGTPGRLIDHIQRGNIVTEEINTLVLDEADEMLNMGFLKDMETIIKSLPKKRQTLLFSATMPNNIKRISKRYMNKPKYLEVAANNDNMERIKQYKYELSGENKINVLESIIVEEEVKTSIIFCNTRRNVDRVYRELRDRHYLVGQIHGGMEQKKRSRIMESFRKGRFQILVATDVAARGIDIDNLTHIINFDVPRETESYVHRIGRTGRQGREGTAITIATNQDRKQIREITRYTKTNMENLTLKNTKGRKQKQKQNDDMLKLHINAGRKARVGKQDVFQALSSIDGIKKQDIGAISVIPTSTFVEILNGQGFYVKDELNKLKIKGRKRRVNIANNQQRESSFVS